MEYNVSMSLKIDIIECTSMPHWYTTKPSLLDQYTLKAIYPAFGAHYDLMHLLVSGRFDEITHVFVLAHDLYFFQNRKLYRIGPCSRHRYSSDPEFISNWRSLLEQEIDATGYPVDYLKIFAMMSL